MQILNIAGYKFTPLNQLEQLRHNFLATCESLSLKGTILLSQEGINLSLAGQKKDAEAFKHSLDQMEAFSDMRFHETLSDQVPFKCLKVKLKNEIITMRQATANPTDAPERAPAISPQELKAWLDENRDITLLDTRNDYEYRFGTFKGAINPRINQFGALPEALSSLDKDKPLVMFCTGGIRCEKAGLYMQSEGFTQVYQLDTGILGYFAQVGGEHYDGECFIFDERVSLTPDLKASGRTQCKQCQGPIEANSTCTYCSK